MSDCTNPRCDNPMCPGCGDVEDYKLRRFRIAMWAEDGLEEAEDGEYMFYDDRMFGCKPHIEALASKYPLPWRIVHYTGSSYKRGMWRILAANGDRVMQSSNESVVRIVMAASEDRS